MRVTGALPFLQVEALAALTKAASVFPDVVKEMAEPARAAAPLASPQPAQPATSVQMLVALAATEPAVDRRRRMAATADRGLSLLERLKVELLSGGPAPERLQELADWSAEFEIPDDPQLASVAREIEVRVRVELAKYDRKL